MMSTRTQKKRKRFGLMRWLIVLGCASSAPWWSACTGTVSGLCGTGPLCTGDAVCYDGKCRKLCVDSSQCQLEQECATGFCRPKLCLADGDCADDNPCTVNTCDTSAGECVTTLAASSVICRPAGDVCDVAEYCTGSSPTCPADAFADATTACRPAVDVCDVAENCTGTGPSCPPDGYAPTSSVCRPPADLCDAAENCTGASAVCPPDKVAPVTKVCRPVAGACDAAENCDGVNSACPSDAYAPASTVCRVVAGPCDVVENCTGTSIDCPADAFQSAATVCRAVAGACDVAENCTGTSAGCPADAFAPSTTVCRPVADVCDVAENCTGAGPLCPADVYAGVGVVCRASRNACDTAESCTGASPHCPADSDMQLGYVCTAKFCFTHCEPGSGASPCCLPIYNLCSDAATALGAGTSLAPNCTTPFCNPTAPLSDWTVEATNSCYAGTVKADGFAPQTVGPGQLLTVSVTMANNAPVLGLISGGCAGACLQSAYAAGMTTQTLQDFNNTATAQNLIIRAAATLPPAATDTYQLSASVYTYSPQGEVNCTTAQGETPLAAGSYYYNMSLIGASNKMNLASTGCTGASTPGPDSIIPVSMTATTGGVDATYFMTNGVPVLYLLTTCTDGTTCLAGVDAGASTSAHLTYSNTSASAVTAYLYVDGHNAGLPNQGLLTLTVQ